jgi:hypothetical protein
VKNHLDLPARIESRREVFAIPVLSVSSSACPNSHGNHGTVYFARPISSLRNISVPISLLLAISISPSILGIFKTLSKKPFFIL